jgi:hypothetical protein
MSMRLHFGSGISIRRALFVFANAVAKSWIRPRPDIGVTRGGRTLKITAIEFLRIVLFLGLFGLALVSGWTHELFIAATAVIAASLGLYLLQNPMQPCMGMAWQCGFLFFICRDGVLPYEEVWPSGMHYFIGIASARFGPYQTACSFLVAGFAVSMMAYCLFFRFSRKVHVDAGQSWLEHRYFSRRRNLFFGLFVSLLMLVVVVDRSSVISMQLQGGRILAHKEAFGSGGTTVNERNAPVRGPRLILRKISQPFLVFLPVAIAYMGVFVWKLSRGWIFLLILPSWILMIPGGTRFTFAFSVIGVVMVLLTRSRLRIRHMAGMVLGLPLALLVFAMMSSFRVEGLGNWTLTKYEQYLSEQGILGHSEQVLQFFAKIVEYHEVYPHRGGDSLGHLVWFFVPRALWPGKPLTPAYWFPREWAGVSDYVYSVSISFAGPPYIDFGFWGGLLVLAVGGIILGLVDRSANRIQCTSGHIGIVLVAPMAGPIMFAMRSPLTAWGHYLGAAFFGMLFVLAVRPRRRREPAGALPEQVVTPGELKATSVPSDLYPNRDGSSTIRTE